MKRTLVNPDGLHPAPGFSHVSIAEGTRVVHFAGQLGLAPDFSLVAEDLHGQTAGAMRNVKLAMDAVDVSWDQIVRRTVYTTEPTAYQTITAAIDEVTEGAEHPAQTIVGVTGLAVPGCLIEIECTAVVE
jgi:enamine deaminase RidA (YjgF/YER057c/UK114 family)